MWKKVILRLRVIERTFLVKLLNQSGSQIIKDL